MNTRSEQGAGMQDLRKENWVYGGAFIVGLAIVAMLQYLFWSRAPGDCSVETFGEDAAAAWNNREYLAHSACYQKLFRDHSDLDLSQQAARDMEAILARDHPRRGYKIGGHDASMWDRIGLPGPMFGVFYGEDAFFENGATVPIRGQVMNYEPDMLLRIGDERINEAESVEEAMRYVDRIYAFIELPVLLGDPAELQEGFIFPFLMQATNLGARHGVIGEYLDTADDPEIFENLRNLTVISANPDGTERSIYEVAERDSVHPVIVALQAAESLRKRGESLKKGDVISVGAMMEEFIDPAVPIEGKRHVHYYIGDTVISVAAGFRE